MRTWKGKCGKWKENTTFILIIAKDAQRGLEISKALF